MAETSIPARLESIHEKVATGHRLSASDGELLFQPEVDLHAVGRLADQARRRVGDDVAYYNINVHVNPTNVCEHGCALCAYRCTREDPRAYVLDFDTILAQAGQAAQNGATELHLVGGLHPDKPFGWYLEITRLLHASFPRLHLKAWTAVEIAWFARRAERPVQAVLETLLDAGLGSLPGGGAEIFDPTVRRQIAHAKPDADTWLEVHRVAHGLGLKSNATMLYGHVESMRHRVDHLVRLRTLQDETGGFQAFIPLAFHPDGTRLAHVEKTSGLDDLRTMAVGRLMLDNFDHIKAYWISLGVGTAQVALAYGADDLDGTVRQERIHHDAGSQSPQVLAVDELRRLITEAGRRPVERDTLYRPIHRHGMHWEVEA